MPMQGTLKGGWGERPVRATAGSGEGVGAEYCPGGTSMVLGRGLDVKCAECQTTCC